MTKDEILDYFKDIDAMYNDCTRYDTLKRMLDELQEPCTDAISRQAVLNLAKFDGRENLGSIIHAFDVEQLPPVTPAEKVGQWEWVRYEGFTGNWHCSECRTIIPHMPEKIDNTPIYKWCPMCGAKMASTTGAESEEV